MFERGKQVRLWGNHIDPQISAESYLNSENAEAAQWAVENERELQQMDRDVINLYRRHMAGCDLKSVEQVQQSRVKHEKTLATCKRTRTSGPEDQWIERIFSKRPEDLYQLVYDPKLAQALKELTPHQQNVVHMSIVRHMKNNEIAKRLNTTDRNVRDILQRAYARIRDIIGENRGEGYLSTAIWILFATGLPTFAVGWGISSWIYPKIKKAIIRRAA